jgi:hypothetical protein
MRAKYRTALSCRRAIVSSDKNVAGRYTWVTDCGSGMDRVIQPSEPSNRRNVVHQKQRILVVEP